MSDKTEHDASDGRVELDPEELLRDTFANMTQESAEQLAANASANLGVEITAEDILEACAEVAQMTAVEGVAPMDLIRAARLAELGKTDGDGSLEDHSND